MFNFKASLLDTAIVCLMALTGAASAQAADEEIHRGDLFFLNFSPSMTLAAGSDSKSMGCQKEVRIIRENSDGSQLPLGVDPVQLHRSEGEEFSYTSGVFDGVTFDYAKKNFMRSAALKKPLAYKVTDFFQKSGVSLGVITLQLVEGQKGANRNSIQSLSVSWDISNGVNMSELQYVIHLCDVIEIAAVGRLTQGTYEYTGRDLYGKVQQPVVYVNGKWVRKD